MDSKFATLPQMYDEAMARISELEAELAKLREGQEPVAYRRKYLSSTDFMPHEPWCNDGISLDWEPLYASPVTKAVVMPERIYKPATRTEESFGYRNGWNDCLEEVERLNGGQKG